MHRRLMWSAPAAACGCAKKEVIDADGEEHTVGPGHWSLL